MKTNKLLSNVHVDFLYQALETEKGGVQIYATALRCAINKDLKEEWNNTWKKPRLTFKGDRILTALDWIQTRDSRSQSCAVA